MILLGLFRPPFSRLDVPLYAPRPEERRFLPKSAYPRRGAVLLGKTERVRKKPSLKRKPQAENGRPKKIIKFENKAAV
jgi:hypothetical protein